MRDDGDNRGTLIVSAEASLCHPALAAGLYPGACAAVADRRAEARPLHRGFWVVDAREGALLGFVPLVQGLHAVLGRHTEPHVRVDEQHAGVSLRQALLRVRDDDGTLTLNMLDLESSNGIALHDGRQVRALDASGPFAAALGGLMILFLPEEPGATLPEALPVPELWGVAERDANAGRRRGNGLANARPGAGARAAPERERAHSRIVALEGSRHPSERSFVPRSDEAHSRMEVDLWAAREAGAAAFTVSLEGRSMGTLVLTAAQLGEGVLLGRADRCWNLGEAPLPNTLSRVHALLLHEAEQLRVTDLASTNGTTLDGEPTRTARWLRVTDLASTNGTTLDGEPTRTARWEPGQLLVLGGELELEPLFIGPASEA